MRYEKSDAQLDAEAKCPECDRKHKPCLFCRKDHGHDLDARLACHRDASRGDDYLTRLTSTQPPLTRYEKSDDAGLIRYGASEEWVIEEGAVVGQPMSGPMIRRLSDQPGGRFPWADAFGWLRNECRLHHYTHRGSDRPYWRGSLCWEFVRLTCIGSEKGMGRLSIAQASQLLRVSDADALRDAFDDMERHIVWLEDRAEKRAKEDAGRFTIYDQAPTHHAVEGLHSVDCPQCRRAA